MDQAYDVCIRGAGIVGRALALLLARERLRVALVDNTTTSPAQGGDIRAYALNSASRQLLESVRAWPAASSATPVLAMEVHGDQRGFVRFDAQTQGVEALAWIVDVPALLSQLDNALAYQPLVERIETPQGATLTVVCEGRTSTSRTEFGVEFDVTTYPQKAIAARLSCEKPHGGVARQWFSNGEILAFLPLDGNSVALVWSVLEERAATLMAADGPEFLTQLEAASQGTLGRLTLNSSRACWGLQLARANRWCGPGWALAGDAAHTVHPLAGQGLNLGLADARQLADVLQRRAYWRSLADERLLRVYERARKGEVILMGTATDYLQQLFSQPKTPWGLVRNWGMSAFEHSGPLKQWVARRAMGLS